MNVTLFSPVSFAAPGRIFLPLYLVLLAQLATVLLSFIKITSPCQLCLSALERKIKISRDRLSEQHNIYIRLIARYVNA